MFSRLTTWWQQLTTDPLNFLISAVIFAAALLFSLIMHENAHGYMALKCGDPTAKMFGRITLDPRKHLDPIGALCMVFLGIGWAKPVPVNPYNFKKRGRDTILVSVAGICMNLILFIISSFLFVLICRFKAINPYMVFNYTAGMGTILQAMIGAWAYCLKLLKTLMMFNISLAVFNLVPVPPLDGFRLVNQLLFKGRLEMNQRTMMIIQYVFLFICLTGVLSTAFSKVCVACINGIFRLFVGILM